MHMKAFLATMFAISLVALAATADRNYVNVDRHGLALQGYDPVAYFTEKRPIKGDPNITAAYEGATYRFSSPQNKEMFEKDPARYAPQFGGFCAYAVSINTTASIDPALWEIVDGRLILQNSKRAWDKWHKDPSGNLQKADANWPRLARENAR
jgi:YHS domain-containing protein